MFRGGNMWKEKKRFTPGPLYKEHRCQHVTPHVSHYNPHRGLQHIRSLGCNSLGRLDGWRQVTRIRVRNTSVVEVPFTSTRRERGDRRPVTPAEETSPVSQANGRWAAGTRSGRSNPATRNTTRPVQKLNTVLCLEETRNSFASLDGKAEDVR